MLIEHNWLLITIQISAQGSVCYSLYVLESWWFKIKVIIFIDYKFVKHTIEILIIILRTLFWLFISIQIFVIFLNNLVHVETFETWNRLYYFFFLLNNFLFNRRLWNLEIQHASWSTSTNTAYTVNSLVLTLFKTVAGIRIIETFSVCKNFLH
jgi:hypothetical protein